MSKPFHITESLDQSFRTKLLKALEFGCNYLNCSRPRYLFVETVGTSERYSGSYESHGESITLYIRREQPLLAVIETLFHELTHHKQHEVGWLKTSGQLANIKYHWKKNSVRGKGYSITDWESYYFSPHEIQARAKAKRMLHLYVQSPNITIHELK